MPRRLLLEPLCFAWRTAGAADRFDTANPPSTDRPQPLRAEGGGRSVDRVK